MAIGFAILASAVGFWTLGYGVLARQHPHEDAYILFRYAEHLAEGYGIVFNRVGPPSEGATDFLWLVGVAGLSRLGLDVAIAALTLNTIGAGLLGAIFSMTIRATLDRLAGFALLVLVPVVIVGSSAAAAAAVGFSAMMFSAGCAGLYYIVVLGPARTYPFIPVLGFLVALTRPEGVVVGVGFTLVGAWLARQDGDRQRYIRVAVVCGLAGIGYFLWRSAYFGLWLPLPMYVKGGGRNLSIVPGLPGNLMWLSVRISPLPALLLIAIVAVLTPGDKVHLRRIALALLPMIALFLALSAAAPLQNIYWRFQSPIGMLIILALFHVLAVAFARQTRLIAQLAVVALLVPTIVLYTDRGSRLAMSLVYESTPPEYLDTFAPVLGQLLKAEDAVLTNELGRLSYWTEAYVDDISGLVNPATAIKPPTVDDLARHQPQVVVVHHGVTLAVERLEGKTEPVIPVTAARLPDLVAPRVRHLYDGNVSTYRESRVNTLEVAPPIAARFLAESGKYDVFLVDFRQSGGYEHVYAIRRDWPCRNEAVAQLKASFDPSRYVPYLAAKRMQRSQRRAGCPHAATRGSDALRADTGLYRYF